MDNLLATKIYNVMCDTASIEKNLTVGSNSNSYKAIGEKAVLNMIKPLFKKHKLILIPKDGDISENLFEYVDGYGKNKLRAITQLKIVFTIVDVETGESVDIVGFGNGADVQDKGSGKAFTYALKTALSKTFMLFSGEDTDNHHSDDIGNTQMTTQPTERKVSTQQLIDLATKKGFTSDDLLKKYKAETGKTIDDVKFIKGETKINYYNQLSKLGDKNVKN